MGEARKRRCVRRRWQWQHPDHAKAYCPGCGVDLVCNPDVELTDWLPGLESFLCPCLMESAWDFDAPVPLLVEGRLEGRRIRGRRGAS